MVRWKGLLVGVLGALFLCGCAGGGSGTLPDPLVQVVNASPDSVALDVLVDDDTVASALPLLGFSPGFVTVDPGDRDLTVLENGTSLELVAEVHALNRDKSYIVVPVGLENFGTEDLKRLRLALIDADRTVPTGNKARLFVIHGYNRKVGFLTPDIDFQSPGDNPLFKIPGMTFGSQATVLFDSGPQSFEVRRAGTTSVLMSGSFTLGPGKIYVVLVTGIEDEAPPKQPQIAFIEIQPRL